jgi:hypothetical protein
MVERGPQNCESEQGPHPVYPVPVLPGGDTNGGGSNQREHRTHPLETREQVRQRNDQSHRSW